MAASGLVNNSDVSVQASSAPSRGKLEGDEKLAANSFPNVLASARSVIDSPLSSIGTPLPHQLVFWLMNKKKSAYHLCK